ncbi:dihydrodipicolinate synthetase family protein [Niveomyces insectorum RCEF 264]|uniref:Dihydrodipicolinate synthetase family protein n=1 Tax=Niveomyces insectorum RCEF 264 TaxID=1081102 RepID=A0A162J4W5_9HYPO|nr:dihydrodipicolinate synthetase family protein [Niveomyces insectorum RCEF 264]
MMPRQLVPGIYAPTQTFFLQSLSSQLSEGTDLIDAETTAKHAVRLVTAGVAGLVVNGSNGEAALLCPGERASVAKITRDALDAAGFGAVPVIAGASANSVGGTLALCLEAAHAGADAVLLLPPVFVGGGMGAPGIERYFKLVADESVLPIVLYNYPAAGGGFDFDSDALVRLSKHPNIIGTKFTCGSIGKMARVIGEIGDRVVREGYRNDGKAKDGSADESNQLGPYFAFAGVADFIFPSIVVGGTGAIVGAANVFPRACVHVYNLAVEGRLCEARKAQQALAKADWSLTKRGVPGFKAILERFHGYGGSPRSPMAGLSVESADELCAEIAEFMRFEQTLPTGGHVTKII